MAYDHEADDARGRTPDKVQATVAQSDVVLAVDGAGRRSECGIVLGQILEADLFAVDPWPAPSTECVRWRRQVSDGVALGTSCKLMPGGE